MMELLFVFSRVAKQMESSEMRRGLQIVMLALALCFAPRAQAQTYEEMRDSLEAAVKLLEKFPEDNNLRLKKASWNLLLEQWEYAKREYDIVLDRDPRNVAALYYRAYVNEKLHRYKFARKDYEDMLAIVPGDFNGQLGLALLLQKDLRYTEAMNRINHLVEQYPDHAVAYAARAGMESERGMLELAEYDFTEAMRLDPDNTDYIINRADVRIRMQHMEDARKDLDLAVEKGISRPALADLYARCRK